MNHIRIFGILALVLVSCKETPKVSFTAYFAGPPDSIPKYLQPFHQNEEFVGFFTAPKPPPVLDTTLDIETLGLEELRLARNFVYARNGFLFEDILLRGFFNQFPWYQPIYFDSTFRVQITEREKRWVQRIEALEKVRLQANYITDGGVRRANVKNIVNQLQFKELSPAALSKLDTHGFYLNGSDLEQMWQLYDKNQYEAFPSFVTTDLFVQLLHMHFKYLTKHLESEFFIPELQASLLNLHAGSILQAKAAPNADLQKAALWNQAYFATALLFLDPSLNPEIPDAWQESVQQTLSAGQQGEGVGSAFMQDEYFDFSQLLPRGHYDSEESLQQYFRAIRFLGLARILLDDPLQKNAAFLQAELTQKPLGMTKMLGFIRLLSGQQNGSSIFDLGQLMKGRSAEAILSTPALRDSLLAQLEKQFPRKVKRKGATPAIQAELDRPSLRLAPLLASPDAEILQRLVDLKKRPVPEALDIFAVAKVPMAQSILLAEGNAERWPGYSDTLLVLQKSFPRQFDGGDIYSNRLQNVLQLFRPDSFAPPFMHTEAWQRKTLLTATAAWTLQKQENVLYHEQAGGAECGEGGGPPPPLPMAYVEPVLPFWREAARIVKSVDTLLQKEGWRNENLQSIHTDLLTELNWMIRSVEIERSGKSLPADIREHLQWIGGSLENLTYGITGMNNSSFAQSPESQMASVTDVYSFNDKILLEATGRANALFAIVEIDGLLYLMRGATLSHYEWVGEKRLTDREWQKQIADDHIPARPQWQEPLFFPEWPATKPHFSNLLPYGC